MSSSAGDKFLFFVVGMGVGGVCALLFAPKSGKETRDDLARRAQESREYLNKKVDEGRQLIEEGSRRVGGEVTSVVERGRGEVGDLVDKGRKVVRQQKDQLSAAYEAGKEAYQKEKAAD